MCASGPIQLSNTPPTRLIQSTGNLYWTSLSGGKVAGPETESFIFRALKLSRPGEEVQLYAETGVAFWALTFAQVGGEFYGYFVVNNPSGIGVSQIKRIPLAGGPAVVLATRGQANAPSAIGLGADLVTDGSFLCWSDDEGVGEGIRSMPIGGGPVTTLAASPFYPLSVLGGTLYYIGLGGNGILSVPTRGGTPSTVVGNQPSPITALHVREAQPQRRPPVARAERPETPGPPPPPRPDTAVVWGRYDGGVYGMLGGQTTTYQEPGEQWGPVYSVYSNDTRTLWFNSYVHSTMGEASVLMAYEGATTTLSSEFNRILPRDVLADGAAAYWTDTYVEGYIF
jgi:hypothetical protein